MDSLANALEDAVRAWHARGWPTPDVVTVSGSGLDTDLGEQMLAPRPWSEVLPFPVRGIEGHPLTFDLVSMPISGAGDETRVVLNSRGRLHAYQGYTPAQVVFSIRLARLLGARVLLMTNSSGGLLPHLRPGDLVLVGDQLNLSGMNPLWGEFPSSWGPQFPDMLRAYDPALRALLHEEAEDLGFELEDGVYAGVAGPSYETPAEVRMLRQLGGSVVGMSTVLEIIAAHHIGLRCACLSVVSNPGAGVTDEILDHADVLARAQEATQRVRALFERVLASPKLLGD